MIQDAIKKDNSNSRKKVPAFLLSILVPGLGQLYNGQVKKSAICAITLLILPIGFNLLGLKPYFWAYSALIVLIIVSRLIIAIEAAITAGRIHEYQPRNYNKWYIYLAIIPVWYLITNVGEHFTETTRYKSFKVTSDAGNPNIIVGEYVVEDLDFYNTEQPAYGDLVVISNGTGNFVYRVVGLPNDTLNIENNLVIHKKKTSLATLVAKLNWHNSETEEFIESLPNGFKYQIYRNKTPINAEVATIKDIIVPEGTYFLLGDNRDSSEDSRYLGFVNKQQIQGKLISIYFSRDFSKINKRL